MTDRTQFTRSKAGPVQNENRAFSSPKYKPTNAIPPGLREGNYNLASQMYTTTTSQAFYSEVDRNHYKNPIFSKAPPCYKVDYTSQVIEKVNSQPRGRELITGNQSSEMKANYVGDEEVRIDLSANRPQLLNEHHSRFQNQVNSSKLKPIYIKESFQQSNVEKYYDPYATQSQLSYQRLTKDRIEPYAKNDVATYWACENFPKVRGFGPRENVLPKLPPPTEPLTDRIPHFSKIKQIPDHNPASFVPNSGLKPTYVTYENHDLQQVQQSQVYKVPRPRQFSVTDHGDFNSLPNMYGTTYRTYEAAPEALRNQGLTNYY